MVLLLARCLVVFISLGTMASASAAVSTLHADQVILTNGDRITGRLLSTDATSVSLATDAEGTISIRRGAIAAVVRGVPVTAPGMAPVGSLETEPVTPVRTVAPAVQGQGMNRVLPAPLTSHCMKLLKPVPVSWALQFQGAPNEVVVGTVSQNLFGAGLDVSLCEGSPKNQTSFAAAGTHSRFYEHGSGAITADVADAEMEQQHFFHSPQGSAVFAVGDAFNNNALGMAMQKSVGFGLLSRQFYYKAAAYDIAGDIRYLNQHLDGVSPALNLAGTRLKEQVDFQGTTFRVDEQAWIMPMFNDVHALQAYASVAPSVTLKPWLTLGLSEEESYLENAPYPRRKNYFTSMFTLTLQGGSALGSK